MASPAQTSELLKPNGLLILLLGPFPRRYEIGNKAIGLGFFSRGQKAKAALRLPGPRRQGRSRELDAETSLICVRY